MNGPYLIVRSVTQALRIRQTLVSQRVRCQVERTPAFLKGKGCNYCVRIDTKDLQRAQSILSRESFLEYEVYSERGERL